MARFPANRLREPMKRATGSARRGLTAAATPTPPLRISAAAAAGAPDLAALPIDYDLPDPRRNTTKLRDMFYSDELEFLMEAHVSGHPAAARTRPVRRAAPLPCFLG